MRFLSAYPLTRDAIFIGALLLAWWWVRSALSEPEVDFTRYDHSLYAQGRLFLLQKQGYGDIYVFGTFHSNDPWILDLPEVVNSALLSAQLFATEAGDVPLESTEADDKEARARIEAMAQLCLLPADQSVRRLLGDELFAELVERFSDAELLAAVGFSRVPAPEALDRTTPWCMTELLGRPLQELRRGQQGAPVLDYALVRDARDRKIAILHLESADEQLELLASMPLGLQVEELATILQSADYDGVSAAWHEGIAYYLSGSNDVRTWLDGFSESYKSYTFRDVLIARNRTMVERLLQHVDDRTTFVATGAAHLSGEEGIVNLLAREGYSVTVLEPPP